MALSRADYSQAMDIAGLSKLPKQTILNLIMALGFMAHGYATGEFEVTEERLGVYQTTEHIVRRSLSLPSCSLFPSCRVAEALP